MKVILFLFILLSFLCCFSIYKKFYGLRNVFSDRFSKIITSVASSVFPLLISMFIYLLVPLGITTNTLIAVLIGLSIGISFGSLVKYQSLLVGFFQGTVGAIMGTMLGAIILNPTLCGLPPSYFAKIHETILLLSSFAFLLILSSFWLLVFSLRV